MAKVEVFNDGSVMFNCPGCGENHRINTPDNMRWTWNGDINNPTINPSIHRLNRYGDGRPASTICHLFVRDGKIEFLNDCQHELKGQTIEMPEIEE